MNQIQYLKSSLALYFNFIRDYSKYCFVLILCRRFNFLNTNKLWVRVQVYFASPKRNCCDSILVIRFVTCHSITSLPARWASQESFSFSFLSVNFSDQDCKIDYILRLTLIIKERVEILDKMLQQNYLISLGLAFWDSFSFDEYIIVSHYI